jgi:hypothetical protein
MPSGGTQLVSQPSKGDIWQVGSIQQSVLTPTQFNNELPASERGKWQLADGSSLAGTKLGKIIDCTSTPDLHGDTETRPQKYTVNYFIKVK